MNGRAKLYYEFESFRLDPAERLLLRDGHPVSLTPKAFDTLVLLVQNSGHLLEKDELLKSIWPDTFVEEANLANNISLLRRLLGQGAGGQQYIETQPKRGYRFVAAVKEVRDDASEPDGEGVPAGETPEANAVRTIAVLPFRSLRQEESDEYMELGITDVLITRLSNINEIVIRPTSAVRKYAALEQDPVAAGRELQVGAVLEGSIRKLADRYRITVQLVNVRDGISLWADKFDQKCADIFDVEDSISEQVAKALTLRLSGEQKRVLAKRYTGSTQAYHSYLKGRYHWNKWNKEGFRKAIEHFQQSIEHDPVYALAYTGLADAYGLLGLNGLLSPKEAMPRAEAAAVKALEIDEGLAEAHVPFACVRCWYHWDFAGAEQEFKRAIELNSNYAIAHQAYALYLTAMGRQAEAQCEIQVAQRIDPLSLALNAIEGFILYNAGEYDRAIEQSVKTIELDPNFHPAYERLGDSYLQKGMLAEAIAAFEKALALSGRSLFTLAELGSAYARSGRREETESVLDELKERFNKAYVSAWIYAGLGENDSAFEWLEKAYEERDSSIVYLKVDPRLTRLRSDRRFADLLRRINLAT